MLVNFNGSCVAALSDISYLGWFEEGCEVVFVEEGEGAFLASATITSSAIVVADEKSELWNEVMQRKKKLRTDLVRAKMLWLPYRVEWNQIWFIMSLNDTLYRVTCIVWI